MMSRVFFRYVYVENQIVEIITGLPTTSTIVLVSINVAKVERISSQRSNTEKIL